MIRTESNQTPIKVASTKQLFKTESKLFAEESRVIKVLYSQHGISQNLFHQFAIEIYSPATFHGGEKYEDGFVLEVGSNPRGGNPSSHVILAKQLSRRKTEPKLEDAFVNTQLLEYEHGSRILQMSHDPVENPMSFFFELTKLLRTEYIERLLKLPLSQTYNMPKILWFLDNLANVAYVGLESTYEAELKRLARVSQQQPKKKV